VEHSVKRLFCEGKKKFFLKIHLIKMGEAYRRDNADMSNVNLGGMLSRRKFVGFLSYMIIN